MVYKWGKYHYAVDAETVGKYFEEIEKKYGELNRENVLESARSEDSPIHSLFEWNNTVAAEKYRLEQASLLIINLDVEVQSSENKPIICRAFMNVSESKNGSFINIESAFKNQESKEIVLKRALQELQAFELKYRNLKELTAIFEKFDEIKEGVRNGQ